MTFIVGLTGGIGSGKSTVADLFGRRGAALVDTDAIAHELTAAQGAAMPAIVSTFGPAAQRVDGALDRAVMRRLVFSDSVARAKLEGILHPLIREYSAARCVAAAAAPYVVLVVPLLLETGSFRRRCDRVLVVDCLEEAQIARVRARSGLASDEVRVIMSTQVSRSDRLAAADDIVVNDVDLEALVPQVDSLHQLYLRLARAKLDTGR